MTVGGARWPVGVIHGRFQVLHNDHLRYLLAGWELCDRLVVGVTNPDPSLTREEASAPERSAPGANPLTYFERQAMVRAVLAGAGVPPDALTVTPFPVNVPELYGHYVPLDAVFFLTIFDDWGRAKLERFRSLGLETHVLWERSGPDKGIRATEVRDAMALGRSWEHLVPPATASLARSWDLPGRLAALLDSGRG